MQDLIPAPARFQLRADIAVSIGVAALVVWLNYYGAAMEGLLPCYQDFKRIILAGFDPAAATNGTPTFPMWGYGWLMLITENQLALLTIQMTLALIATHVTLSHVTAGCKFSPSATRTLRWMVALALPWYAFHAVRWPYSIAASLFLFSVVCLYHAIQDTKCRIWWIVASGTLFGLMLNFRSDYYLMPIGLAMALVWLSTRKLPACGHTCAWLVAIYVMLIPWMMYTWRATGHPLLTSTNGGHVLFIGLGNLPDNKWGIVASDDDPTMHRLLTEQFSGSPSSLVYESDRFLLEEFKQRVKDDPREYLRKCVYALSSMVRLGAYPGEFFRQSAGLGDDAQQEFRKNGVQLTTAPASFVREHGVEKTVRTGMELVSVIIGRVVVVLGFVALPFVLICAFYRRDSLGLLFSLAVVYQAALQIVAYTMPAYTANMFLIHILNIVQGGSLLAGRIRGNTSATTNRETATDNTAAIAKAPRRAA